MGQDHVVARNAVHDGAGQRWRGGGRGQEEDSGGSAGQGEEGERTYMTEQRALKPNDRPSALAQNALFARVLFYSTPLLTPFLSSLIQIARWE